MPPPSSVRQPSARGAQQRGFQWEIDDLRDPKIGAQKADRHRRTRQLGHANRGAVHHTIGTNQRCFKCDAGPRAAIPVARPKCCGEVFGAPRFHVMDGQPADTLAEQRLGHGRPCAAGAELHDFAERGVRQAAGKTLGEARAIGVVADAAAALQHHGVHRAECLRFLR